MVSSLKIVYEILDSCVSYAMILQVEASYNLEKQMLEEYEISIFDFETVDTSSVSQAIQFAGLNTNNKFEETGRLNLRIKLLPYMLASARALEVTSIEPDDLDSEDRMEEFYATKEIQSFLDDNRRTPKRLFIYYNGLQFDEEFLRVMLFRNLKDPYITTRKDSRRIDLLDGLRFLSYVRPGIISPKIKPDEKISWRLSDVTEVNGINADNAHDAMADSIMTAKLAKMFYDQAPDVFNAVISLSDKGHVNSLLRNISNSPDQFLYYFTHFGAPSLFPIAAVVPVGSPPFKFLGVDLTQDPKKWMDMSVADIKNEIYKGDSPFHMVKMRASPFLFENDSPLITPTLREKGIYSDPKIFHERAKLVNSDAIRKKLSAAVDSLEKESNSYFSDKKTISEQSLYANFVSNRDRNIAVKFHSAKSWEEKIKIADEFVDSRLKDFSNRIIAMHAPEELVTYKHAASIEHQMELRLEEIRNPHYPMSFAMAEDSMAECKDQELISNYKSWLDNKLVTFSRNIQKINGMKDISTQDKDEKEVAPPSQYSFW